MDTTIARLEETVRMCDSTIARIEATPGPTDRLLDELKRLRKETLAEITRLRARAILNAGAEYN